MKIIKEGEQRPIVFECSHCGCVFEATSKDYIKYSIKHWFYEAKCPYCRKAVVKQGGLANP